MRRPWLSTLRVLIGHLAPGEFSPPLFGTLYDAAREEGMSGPKASRVALRGCKLAEMLLDGAQQRVAARELGVSERTAKYDARRLRQVVEDGTLELRVVWRLVAGLNASPGPTNGVGD